MNCPACGDAVPAAARFCPSCGHRIDAPDDQRRVVTVVFADLVGFTTISEARDPEQVKNLVDRGFERLAADVTAYGGKVDKIVGDALIALFGAPVAHEDDAERAVRAALQIQRTVATFADETGIDVRMRVGVNTGEVLVGGLRAGDDYTAMGDVVNVASRLQAAAEPGQVVVGPETHAATRDVVRYEPLGPLTVKGRGNEVDAWIAQEALAPPGYRPRRVRTPLVGRDAELGMLRHGLDIADRARRPHLALIVGEAGIGKSRLGEEIAGIAATEHRAAIYLGRCVPYGEANPWWPVSQILRQAFGSDLSDPSELTTEKIRRGVRGVTGRDDHEAQRVVDGVLHLMGVENPLSDVDPSRALDEGVNALVTLVEAIGSRRLLVLFLADLHWADQLVLDLLDRLLEQARNVALVVVGTARPELEDRWTPGAGRHNVLWLNLGPLDSAALDELLDTMLEGAVPEPLRAELHDRSGGNPFFVEELVALLSDTGDLADRPDGGGGALVAELPSSLRGLVAARLDSVGPNPRAMLEDAAVVGRSGSVSALVALGEARGEPDVAGALDELIVRELLVVDGGQFEFKSEVVREVAYETLTKSSRARRHAVLAGWLEDRAERTGRREEFIEQVAHHASAAATLVDEIGTVEGVPLDIRERALSWLERAALRAQARDSALVAEQFFDDAIGLLTAEEDAKRRELILGRAITRVTRHDLPGARADAEEVLGKARDTGDVAQQARSLTVLGQVEQKAGDVDAALVTLEEAMRLADEADDPAVRADSLRHWGMTQLFRGDLEAAESAIAEARGAFQILGDRRSEAWALQNLAWIAFTGGDSDAADTRLSEAAAMFEELSDWGGRGWALGLLGFVRLAQGRLHEAGALADEVIETARRAGDRWGLGMTLVLRSSAEMWLGRPAGAMEAAREAREIFRAIDDAYGQSLAVANLARAGTSLGRLDETRTLLEEASVLFARPGSMPFAGANLQANVYCQIGDATSALAASRDVTIESPAEMPSELLVVRALALLQAGRIDDAMPFLDVVLNTEASQRRISDDGARIFGTAVRVLAEAAAGDPRRALDTAAHVVDRGLGTYVDQLYARAGIALAYAQQGEGSDARREVGIAVEQVDATEDRLAQALARLVRAHVLRALDDPARGEAFQEAHEFFEAVGVDPYGWETLFRGAATGTVGEPARNP